MIGDYSDGVLDPYDLAPAVDGLGRRVIHGPDPTAEAGDTARVEIFTPGRRTSMP